jgi:peptidoglycan hydrolase CwlO-like protein
MRKLRLVIFAIIFLFSTGSSLVFGQNTCPSDDPCKNISDTQSRVSCYTNVVNVCSSQRESMTAQVVYLSTRIELTKSKIENAHEKILSLESEIEELGQKIDKLENSMTNITSVFLNRVIATYKYGETSFLDILLTSSKVSDILNRYKYIQTVQAHDRRLLFQLQNSKVNYQDQKVLRENKKLELDSAKIQLEKEQVNLAFQKKEKELFLETTRNSESRYRQELAAAKRESEGIQQAASLLSSAGVPHHVSRGDIIGLMGNSGFSTGPHLHFAVYNLRESDLDKFNFNAGYENPFNVLSSKTLPFDPAACDDVSPNSKTTKGIGGGSWQWPMNSPTISQCFGHTPYSWRYASGIHNGIDMYDDGDIMIRAPESGNAYSYRGGQSAGNGVFIFHDNGKMTLYWHLQ